ncbi:MAG TPA: hypothetical protein VFM68_00475 [Candidatus Saccharimonadales bacterium]|nr:hypothetical protein [Candidatus Saccharimonadales bacterium]
MKNQDRLPPIPRNESANYGAEPRRIEPYYKDDNGYLWKPIRDDSGNFIIAPNGTVAHEPISSNEVSDALAYFNQKPNVPSPVRPVAEMQIPQEDHDGHSYDVPQEDIDIDAKIEKTQRAKKVYGKLGSEIDDELESLLKQKNEQDRRREEADQRAEQARQRAIAEQEAADDKAALAEVLNSIHGGRPFIPSQNYTAGGSATPHRSTPKPAVAPSAHIQEQPGGEHDDQGKNTGEKQPNRLRQKLDEMEHKTIKFTAGLGVLALSAWGVGSVVTGGDEPSPKAAAEIELTAAELDVANCFADDGTGEALFSGEVGSMKQEVKWPLIYKGSPIEVLLPTEAEDDGSKTRHPYFELAQVPFNYAACVPEQDVDSFIKIDDKNITVDMEQVEAQAAFGPVPMGAEDTRNINVNPAEPFAGPGEVKGPDGEVLVTKAHSEQAAAALHDSDNINYLMNSVTTDVGALLTDSEGEYADEMQAVLKTYESELEQEIESAVKEAAKEQGKPVPDVTIDFVGAMPDEVVFKGIPLETKEVTYENVGPKSKESITIPTVTVDPETLEITGFKPVTQ